MAVRLRLRELMDQKNASLPEDRRMTQAQFAEKVNLSESRFSQYARNFIQRVDLETIENMCRYFNVTPNDLFVFDPEIEQKAS